MCFAVFVLILVQSLARLPGVTKQPALDSAATCNFSVALIMAISESCSRKSQVVDYFFCLPV